MKLGILLFTCICYMLWLLTTPFLYGSRINLAENATVANWVVPLPLVAMVKTIDEGNITIITGTHTKQTKQKDIQQELLKEVEKGNEQRKSANNMDENIPRPRKVANTAIILQQPLHTTGHKKANTTTITTTTTKSKLIFAKPQIVADGVERNSYRRQSKLIEPIQSEIVDHKKADQNLTTEIVLNTTPTTIALGVTLSTNKTNMGTNASTTITNTKNSLSTASSIVSSNTTTTKLTTTLKPTKPKVTFSRDIHPEWDIMPSNQINVESKVTSNSTISLQAAAEGSSKSGSLLVITPKIAIVSNNLLQQYEPPQVQPSQEKSTASVNNNDYIVHFFTIIVTLPLAIGVGVTIYQRFRAFWSTRHYHRMDFLVDGLYND